MKSRTKHINSFSVQGLNNTQSNGSAYPSISSAYWQPAPNPTPYLVPGNLKRSFFWVVFRFNLLINKDYVTKVRKIKRPPRVYHTLKCSNHQTYCLKAE